jgi:hypothetical protein
LPASLVQVVDLLFYGALLASPENRITPKSNYIFDICESAERVIMFFYDQYESNNRTNPLWPWLSNRKNYFPVSQAFNSQNFEVVGNLYEGYKK